MWCTGWEAGQEDSQVGAQSVAARAELRAVPQCERVSQSRMREMGRVRVSAQTEGQWRRDWARKEKLAHELIINIII